MEVAGNTHSFCQVQYVYNYLYMYIKIKQIMYMFLLAEQSSWKSIIIQFHHFLKGWAERQNRSNQHASSDLISW